MGDPSELERLFHHLSNLEPAERARALATADIDNATRRRVLAMLEADERTDVLFDQPPPHVGAPRLEVGQIVGRYQLTERIGEGGMGEVFRARQEIPIRRDVAVKMIKVGMDTRNVIRRFHAERQLLALMDHPNIASVLDAGEGPQGRPFFVMEFVRGEPLTAFADRKRLTVRERIRLFLQACRAVQHAHQKGIIHRDLKPSNMLVTAIDGHPVVKVIDFGIARLAAGEGSHGTTRMTQYGQRVGTPEYMSPEQAAGIDAAIDTGSDIYSLGVILYELLCGTLPFDRGVLRDQDDPAIQLERMDPVRPSARLASTTAENCAIAAARRANVQQLSSALKDELDWITLKSLENDRAERYGSAGELAADLERYLDGAPVLARRATWRYRLRKSYKRNRVAFASGALVFAALIIGVVATTWFAIQARQAERLQAAATQRASEDARNAAYANYRSSLSAAALNLDDDQPASAAHYLGQIEPEFRHWEWRHLHTRVDRSLGPLAGAADLVFGTDKRSLFAFTSDGSELRAVVTSPPRVMAWSVADRTLRFSRPLPDAVPNTLLIDATAETVAFVSTGGELRVERADDGQLLRVLPMFEGSIPFQLQAVGEYDPAGRFLVFAGNEPDSEDERLRFLCHIVDLHSGDIQSFGDGRLWLYPTSGSSLRVVRSDNMVRTLDAHTGELLALERIPMEAPVRAALALPDGSRFYGSTWSGELFEWRFGERRVRWRTPAARMGAQFFVTTFGEDQLVTGGRDGLVRRWDTSGRLLQVLGGHGEDVLDGIVHPNGHLIATRGLTEIRIWDPALVERADVLGRHDRYVYPVAFDPAGSVVASGGWDGTLRLWDVGSRRSRRELRLSDIEAPQPVREILFHEAGALMVLAPESRAIVKIDLRDLRQEEIAPGPNEGFDADPVRPRVALLRYKYQPQRKLVVYDYEAGQEVFVRDSLRGPSGDFSLAVAYSLDGSTLAFTLGDGRLRIHDAGDLEERTVVELQAKFAKLEFSPDGATLAGGRADGAVVLWDTTSWEKLAELPGHIGNVYALAFHPDGTRLASGGADAQIRIWDMETLQELVRLKGHRDYVYSLDFDPAGRALVSGSGDTTVRIWDTRPMSAVAEARSRPLPAI